MPLASESPVTQDINIHHKYRAVGIIMKSQTESSLFYLTTVGFSVSDAVGFWVATVGFSVSDAVGF
jgi:hypothetical protein